ncbi:DUF192 domain-containing protein [Halosimplex pelagicum]|uniref:DUF192 domain-containing protein n=1 Tax=Halosimplex pelagicum TaxID=869886 RepID=A0A7D5PCJ4_9EURY|nr:DUF192 domain-containing protein [Halosimplex pelagicum]QLH83365.1 DUF192 domain-containing protein [Halosimplex pelagicum]
MVDGRIVWGFGICLLLLVGGVYAVQSGLLYQVNPPDADSYDRVTVTAYDGNGTELATVEARVADTRPKRIVGLSNTSELATGEGMLFVHDAEEEHGYVMREMAFPLDIVFVGADERVTTIHHAGVPEGSPETTYSGRGKWVLEVPRGWANRTGVEVGDRIAIPEAAHDASG